MEITDKHHRRSIRFTGYDYAQAGAYFITICTHNRECLFGNIIDGTMQLNEYGQIVYAEWMQSAVIRPRVTLDLFVVMPNHLHGIIVLADGRRGTLQRAPTLERFGKLTSDSIPTIIRLFKSATTKRINAARGASGTPVWQRNYYEQIIRNEPMLNQIREYITNNPIQWALDDENPNVGARCNVPLH